MHVLEAPTDGKLYLSALENTVTGARLLVDGKTLEFGRIDATTYQIDLPKTLPDATNTVVVLECVGNIAAGSGARLLASN